MRQTAACDAAYETGKQGLMELRAGEQSRVDRSRQRGEASGKRTNNEGVDVVDAK